MKRILYIMSEHWNWIKQRPHLIAEYLSREYEVTVICEKRYTKLVNNPVPDGLKVKEIYKLPLTRFRAVKNFNDYFLRKIIFKKHLKSASENYDIFWFNNPEHFPQVEPHLKSGSEIIYDCMDDQLEFNGVKLNPVIYKKVFEAEKHLFTKSSKIFCSSEYLKDKLTARYGIRKDIHVINNAINLSEIPQIQRKKLPRDFIESLSKDCKKITYIGSISEWFDFEIIKNALEKYKDIMFILSGPFDVNVPQSDRLKWFPPVEHELIYEIMKRSDALIMPFRVTELVKSVNPVKLYEYIYSSVPVISVKYGETEKFGDYIHLYSTREEFLGLIELVKQNKLKSKKTHEENIEFAKANTWQMRVKEIIKILNQE